MDFAVPVDHKEKPKESEKRDRYQDLLENWKNMEHESDSDTICNRCVQYSH